MITSARARLISICAVALATSSALAADVPPGSDQSDMRAAALKQYDRDGDGRLSDNERETMRQQVFTRRRESSGGGRGRMAFQFPPEIVKKYDKNGDGQLNEEESQTARAGIQKMFQELQANYDSNHNGRLDPEEMDKIQADKAAGKLQDVPQIFLQMGRRRGPSSRGRPSTPDVARQMDRNRDGRLSEDELKAARAELEKLRAVARDTKTQD